MKFAMGLIQIFRENSQGPAGVSSLGVQGVLPWHPKIFADQLTLFQPRGQILLAK
jgi:hypothetical protein